MMMYKKDVARQTQTVRSHFEIIAGVQVFGVNYRGSSEWEIHYSAPLSDAQITALAFQKIRLKAHRQTQLGDGTVVARFWF